MDALKKRPRFKNSTAFRSNLHAGVWRGLLLLAAMLLAACSPNRTIEAVRVLQDIQAGNGPSALKKATPHPTRASILFAVDGRQRQADLYSPGNAARAGVVLVPGLTPDGRDDRRLVAFAYTLARAQFEVVVPELSGMRSLQVTARDAEPIADAVRYLDEREDARPLGVAAVSFAVGPAVIALKEPAAEGKVDFLLGIGGYYDLAALITYVTTGFYRPSENESWRYRQPKAYGKWVFVLTNADRLADPGDRASFRRWLAASSPMRTPMSPTSLSRSAGKDNPSTPSSPTAIRQGSGHSSTTSRPAFAKRSSGWICGGGTFPGSIPIFSNSRCGRSNHSRGAEPGSRRSRSPRSREGLPRGRP